MASVLDNEGAFLAYSYARVGEKRKKKKGNPPRPKQTLTHGRTCGLSHQTRSSPLLGTGRRILAGGGPLFFFLFFLKGLPGHLRSFIHPIYSSYLFIHPFIHPFPSHSLAHSFVLSFIPFPFLIVRSSIHSFVSIFFSPFAHSFFPSLRHSLLHSFTFTIVRSFLHPFVRRSTHPF